MSLRSPLGIDGEPAPKRDDPFRDASDAARKAMRANKGKDTKPEMAVRRLVHALGYRYRLHGKAASGAVLPGKPDLVFGGLRKVIFVHGCFWHLHDDPSCRGGRIPKAREAYWRRKLEGNVARDARNLAALASLGWEALVLYECGLRDSTALTQNITMFLGPRGDERRR